MCRKATRFLRYFDKLYKTNNVYTNYPKRLIILHDGDNPTLGYFNMAIKLIYKDLPAFEIDISRSADFQLSTGDVIVVIRYLNNIWRNILQKNKPFLSGLIYFMDDDLFDATIMNGLPDAYVRKLKKKALRHRTWLEHSCSEFWMGAQGLVDKYAKLNPKLLTPFPPKINSTNVSPVYVAYHGTSSHRAEIIWLYSVISQIVDRKTNIHVELFGDKEVNQLYRKLPRVTVIQAMSWPNYLSYTSTRSIDIFLAPLINTGFNKGRTHTKFFDAARLGAVGIYTKDCPYDSFVRNNVDGILLENNTDVWVNTILKLAMQEVERKDLAMNCVKRSQELMDQSYKSIERICFNKNNP